jgi:2-polyprenyl-3-methyl-5-hydroxy-6-metoxy-1,4-benzoquinol methylase
MVTDKDGLNSPGFACPACGETRWKDVGQIKDHSITGEWFSLKECNHCRLRVTFPQPPTNEIGRYYASKDYISHSDTRSGLINQLYHKARASMLKKKLSWVKEASGMHKGKILDIGAGTGHFAHYMQMNGWEVLGLEPDPSARKVALEKLGIALQPLEQLSHLEPKTYDVITLWHVLEHVHEVNSYMDRFRSLLKDNGVLIIAVPNYTSADAMHYGLNWAAYDVPRHLWHFSPEAMEKLMSKHQFSLLNKIPMRLDAYYVSMLSEKYKASRSIGPLLAFLSGLKTTYMTMADTNKASSIIYVGNIKSRIMLTP